jgi:hypothetical protein
LKNKFEIRISAHDSFTKAMKDVPEKEPIGFGTPEQIEYINRMTMSMAVALTNPELASNMQRIDEIVTVLRAWEIITKSQIDRLMEKLEYTSAIPEHWTLESYSAERRIMDIFYDAVKRGDDIDQLINQIEKPVKKFQWKNGRPVIDTE